MINFVVDVIAQQTWLIVLRGRLWSSTSCQPPAVAVDWVYSVTGWSPGWWWYLWWCRAAVAGCSVNSVPTTSSMMPWWTSVRSAATSVISVWLRSRARSASGTVQVWQSQKRLMRLIIIVLLYTVSHKKRATLFLIITLAFLGRFLYFLHQWKEDVILHIGVNTTSP